jgi:hypothetical protein
LVCKNHPNRVVTHYQNAGLVGKAYLKLTLAAVNANGFRKTGLFPCNRHTFAKHDLLEQSQRNVTSCCSLETPVPCTSISEEPSTTSGANPQTLTKTVTPCASQITTVVFLPPEISPVPDTFGRKQEQPTKTHSRKGSAAILTNLPYKNKRQEDRKKKETRDRRKSFSKIRLQKRQSRPGDASVSVARGEHEMKKKQRASESSSSESKDCEEPGLIETDEEYSDSDAECCILETSAAKSGPNAQNAASGAMKCVQVQTAGKCFF